MQAEQDLIDRRERQNELEDKHRQISDKLSNNAQKYLDYLIQKSTDDSLSFEQQIGIQKEIRETRRELSSIQRDERVTEHLPNAYKDITGDFNVNAEANVNANANVEFTKYTTDQAKNFLNKLSEMK